jgi:hypothetical protein
MELKLTNYAMVNYEPQILKVISEGQKNQLLRGIKIPEYLGGF